MRRNTATFAKQLIAVALLLVVFLAHGQNETQVSTKPNLETSRSQLVEVRRFAGHSNPNLWALAFQPKGAWLASGGDDQTVRLWDLSDTTQSGNCIALKQTAPVTALAVSQDNHFLAAALADGDIRIYDLTAAQPKLWHSFHKYQGAIRQIEFSPDCKLLAVAERTMGLVRLLEISGQEIVPVPDTMSGAGEEWVWPIAFAPDSTMLAAGMVVGGRDSGKPLKAWIELWDLTKHPYTKRTVVKDSVGMMWHAISFSPDGKQIAYAEPGTGLIHLVSTQTGQVIRDFKGHIPKALQVSFSPDGRRLVSCSYDNTMRVWDVANGIEIASTKLVVPRSPTSFEQAIFSPDSQQVATASKDGLVRLWKLADIPSSENPVKPDTASRLKKVKALFEQGLINKEDYDKKVKEIMDSL